MALSGFIKQLLETDSVFGVEAKKLTGINDGGNSAVVFIDFATLTSAYIDINPISTDSIIITIYNIASSDSIFTPQEFDLTPIRLSLLGLDSYNSIENTRDASYYNKFIYNLKSVQLLDEATLVIELSLPEEAGPDFSTLLNLTNIRLSKFSCDSRVFALIDDPIISKRGPNGSTIFNLGTDIPNNTPLSGITTKYASHYHTETPYELVIHTKNEIGLELLRFIQTGFNTSPMANITYDYAAVDEYLDEQNLTTSPEIEVLYEKVVYTGEDTVVQVAKFGNIGLTGLWSVSGDPVRAVNFTNRFDPGSTLSINGATSSKFPGSVVFYYGMADRFELGDIRRWPPIPEADENAPDAQLRRFQNLRSVFEAGLQVGFGRSDLFTGTVEQDSGLAPQFVLTSLRDEDVDQINVSKGGTTSPDFFVEKVRDPINPIASIGNEFTTFDELLTVLQDEATTNADDFNMVITENTTTLNTITLETIEAPPKIIQFRAPANALGIWTGENLVSTESINIGSFTFSPEPKESDILLSNNGDLVYTTVEPLCN